MTSIWLNYIKLLGITNLSIKVGNDKMYCGLWCIEKRAYKNIKTTSMWNLPNTICGPYVKILKMNQLNYSSDTMLICTFSVGQNGYVSILAYNKFGRLLICNICNILFVILQKKIFLVNENRKRLTPVTKQPFTNKECDRILGSFD